MGRLLREVPIDREVQDYLVRVVRATHPDDTNAPDAVRKYVRYGSSPRGAQAMLSASRVTALLDGRFHVSCEDVRRIALPALRHRVMLSFEGEAEGQKTDDVIAGVLDKVS